MGKFLVSIGLLFLLSGCSNQTEGLKTYENPTLGISFEYPSNLSYSDERVGEYTFFSDSQGEQVFEFLKAEPRYIVQDCEGIKNSSKEKCEAKMVDGRQVITVDNLWLDLSKTIYLPTKDGIWLLATGDPEYFEVLTKILETIQYVG